MYLFILVCVFICLYECKDVVDIYRASVVAFSGLRTVDYYVDYIGEAAVQSEKTDIIVFPELGVNQTSFGYLDIEEIKVKSNPCKEGLTKNNPIQYAISCQAERSQMYVVFGMAEKGEECEKGQPLCRYGFYVYNTAIVVDREGGILSKYRKHNPWLPEFFKAGPNIPTYFDTDFGVRFGYYICFDLLFTHPATDLVEKKHTNNIIYPTWWIDGLSLNISRRYENTLMSAIQVQQAYSSFYHINLLAAIGLINSNGCGIFSNGEILTAVYDSGKDTIAYANVPIFDPIPPPKIQKKVIIPSFQSEVDVKRVVLYSQNASFVELELSIGNCVIEFEVEEGNGEVFEFVVFRDKVKDDVFIDGCGVSNCGFIVEGLEKGIVEEGCSNNDPRTRFKNVKITMNIKDDIRMIMPLVSAGGDNRLADPASQFEMIINDSHNEFIVQSTDSLSQPIQYVFETAILFDKRD